MSKQPFDDFTGGVVTPRGTVYFEDGVLIIPKQKNKKTPAVSGNHDKELKMKKLLLVSKGRYGTSTEIVEPSSVQELTNDIIRIADGFHCDFDEVKGYVYDDSDYDSEYYPDEAAYAVECNSYESKNLLYTGHNCDDGLTYREDSDDFIDENGDVFKTQDEAYEAYTREDFGGDIQSLFSAYTK